MLFKESQCRRYDVSISPRDTNCVSFCSASLTSSVAHVRIRARPPRASPSLTWARVGRGVSIRAHRTAERPAARLLPPPAVPAAELREALGYGALSNCLRRSRPQSFLWTLGDEKQAPTGSPFPCDVRSRVASRHVPV